MASSDGEVVPIKGVTVDGGVESWLKGVEDNMVYSLKNKLEKTYTSIKKRDTKWIKNWISDHPGQMLILALQMRWTTECTAALQRYQDSENHDRKKAWGTFRAD
jgi:hypothetical protein